MTRSTARRMARPLWVAAALLFLLEAWLWDRLAPVIAFMVNLIPWGRLKDDLQRVIAEMPSWAALFVFVVPFCILLPLKFLEVYFIARRQWLWAGMILLLAKLLGLGATAFVFDATRDRLLEMPWFRRTYDWFLWARGWARAQVEPIREQLARAMRSVTPHEAGGFMRIVRNLRRRAYRRPASRPFQ